MQRWFLLFLALLTPFYLIADNPSLWGELKPGSYAVGFKYLFQTDPSRPYMRKFDFEGNPVTGNRSRPLRIHMWYPAMKAQGQPMQFQDYVFLSNAPDASAPTEESRKASTDAFQLRWAGEADRSQVQQVLGMATAAYRDAKPADGKFSLIILAQSSGMSFPYGNSALCEFLASHGYVVATAPSIGLQTAQLSFDPSGVITQLQDLQFVLRVAREFPFVSPDRLGLVGFSFGGLATTIMAMYNTDVDAVVSLESAAGNNSGYSVLFQSPLYVPGNLVTPLLHITTQETQQETNYSSFRSFKYSNVSYLKVKGLRAIDITTLGWISTFVPKFANGSTEDTKTAYQTASEYTLRFLDANVKKDAVAIAALKENPANPALKWEQKPGFPRPPTEEEFVRLLREKGVDRAAEVHRSVRANNSEYFIFEPETLIDIAGDLVNKKRAAEAIQVLQMAAEDYPISSQVFDALGSAYQSAGSKGQAIENYNKALDLNPENAHASEMLKQLQES